MSRDVVIGVIEAPPGGYDSVNATESAPTLSTHGVAGRDGCPEVYWYLSAAGPGHSITVQPWFYDNVAARWCKNGAAIAVIGNEVIQAYQPGAASRHALQVTAIANGPYSRNVQYIEKDA